jgi:hypothetical protein
MKYRRLILAAALPALLACDEARMRISVQPGPQGDPVVRVSRPTWTGVSLSMVLDSAQRSTEFETEQSGSIVIPFTLLLNGQDTATSGAVELPLKSDWRWGLDFFLSDADPRATCFGCLGSRAFDVDPVLGLAPEVKLWVVWGGNSISNPVVY